MKTKPRQSLLDVAVSLCGSAEQAINLAIINGLPLSDDLAAGTELEVPAVNNKAVVAFFNTNQAPATAIDAAESHQLGGIGYMGITINFLVS